MNKINLTMRHFSYIEFILYISIIIQMSQRESNQDEPQNLNFQNQLTSRNTENDEKSTHRESVNNFKLVSSQLPAKNKQSQVIQEQVKDILQSVRLFNSLESKSEKDYRQMEEIFLRHVTTDIKPRGNTDAGEIMLRNGQFIVAFIETLSKKQDNNFLKKYLYLYFNKIKNSITSEKQYFQNKNEMVWKMRDEKKLSSPGSSRNDAHWSTYVEKDSNSAMKSGSVVESENLKNSVKKLKRNTVAPFPQQVNEQEDERSERVTKNVKNNTKKSGKKSLNKNNGNLENKNIGNNKTKKPKQLAYKNSKSKSKSKNKIKNETDEKKENKNKVTKMKSINNGQKQGVSNKKRQTKSIKQLLQTNKNENQCEEQKLGSYFHYQISAHPKNKEQYVNLVRTSARISHKRQEKSKSINKSKKKNKQSNEKKTKKKNQQSDNDSDYTQESQSDFDLNELISEEWIKKNFKLFNHSNVQLYSEFTPLTENDVQITELLRQMELSQQAKQEKQNQKQPRKKISQKKQEEKQEKECDQVYPFEQIQFNDESLTETRMMVPKVQEQKQEQIMQNNQKSISDSVKKEQEKKKRFRQFYKTKDKYRIEIPITIQQVVDPSICGYGVFALLKLSKKTSLEMGTIYAITPLIFGSSRKKRHVTQSIKRAQQIARQHNQNLAIIPINEQILEMVTRKREELKSKLE